MAEFECDGPCLTYSAGLSVEGGPLTMVMCDLVMLVMSACSEGVGGLEPRAMH